MVGARYISGADFLKGAKPCNVVERVYDELAKEREAQGPIDQDQLRRDRDWSYLAHQIVGAEVPQSR